MSITVRAPRRPRGPECTAAPTRRPPRPHPRRRGRCRRARGRRGRPTIARFDSVPSAARSNAVRRRPMRLGDDHGGAVGGDDGAVGEAAGRGGRAPMPSGSTRASAAPSCAGAARRRSRPMSIGRVEVETEVAHVRPARGVDHHVVAVERGDVAAGRRARRVRRARGAAAAIGHRDHEQACRRASSRGRSAGRARRPCVSHRAVEVDGLDREVVACR